MSDPVEKLAKLLLRLSDVLADRQGRMAVFASVCLGIATDFVLLSFGNLQFSWVDSVNLLILVLSPPLYVLMAYVMRRPTARLPSGVEFLLDRANMLLNFGTFSDAQKTKALNELIPQLCMPKIERDYAPDVINMIKTNSVWAVCGRKSDSFATAFWDANVESKNAGNHIERVFIPPENRAEVKALEKAVTPHLKNRMVVRVFNVVDDANSVRQEWSLPVGFGMTLMGHQDNSGGDPTIKGVLIHWGGVAQSREHLGVILRHPAWTGHFFTLYKEIGVRASPIDPTIKDWSSFVKKYNNYGKPWRVPVP